MKGFMIQRLMIIGALLVVGNASYGQYRVKGTTAGGGAVIVGKGSLGKLGPGRPLRSTGDNEVTIDRGAEVLVESGPGIEFRTAGNTLTNLGAITSEGGDGVDFTNAAGLDGETVDNRGKISGGLDGIRFYSENGDISDSVLNNWGSIEGNSGDVGIYIHSENGSIDGNTVNNWGSIGAGGDGSGIDLNADSVNIIGNRVNNWGSISGGNSQVGIYLSANGYVADDTVNNRGSISVGNLAYGVIFYSDIASVTNCAVTNWGVISAGAGGYGIYLGGNYAIGNSVTDWGLVSANGVAIYILGDDNTINLDGHPAVKGLIDANGTGNVLNLQLTGVNDELRKSINAELKKEGIPYNNGEASSGQLTVRGSTYTWDPLIVNVHTSSYEGQAVTANEFAIGANLDSLTYNPRGGSPFSTLLEAIDTSGEVARALEALSPQKYELYGDLAILNSTQLAGAVDHRLDNLRDGSEREEKRWGFFAAGAGMFFRGTGDDGNTAEGSSDSGGTVAGVDGRLGDEGVIGALFSFNYADATLGNDGSHASIQSYTGGIYGGWHRDGYYLNGLATVARNEYASARDILFDGYDSTAEGSAGGDQQSVNVDGGYDWYARDGLTLGPVAGLQYVHLAVDGFDESGGGGADLAVDGQYVNSLQSRLGARAGYKLQLKPETVFAAEFMAGWQHEYLNDSRGIDADFIGSGLGKFSVQTDSPMRDAAVIGAGVNFTFDDRVTLYAEYSLLMWGESYFEETVNAGCRVMF